MKKYLLWVLVCFSLILHVACDNNPTGDENQTDTDYAQREATKTFDGTGVLSQAFTLTEEDTLWYQFNAEAGFSYSTSDLYYGDFDLGVIFMDPDGIIIEDEAILVNNSGAYQVGVFLDWFDESDTYTGTFVVAKYPAVPTELSGMWLLVKAGGTAFGESSFTTFSASNASELIEIRNDSIITYEYEAYEDELYTYSELFAESWQRYMKYGVNGNRLTFYLGSELGSYSLVYEKYSGDTSTISWAGSTFKAPEGLIGTWYLSYEKWREYEAGDGEVFDESAEEIYPAGAASREIIEITSDSVTFYYKSREWDIEIETEPVRENYWLLSNAVISGNQFTVKECAAGTWTEVDGTVEEEAYMEIVSYTRYSGDAPPQGWSEINLPTSYVDMALDGEYTGDLSAGDSIWFRIPVTTGQRCTFEVTSGDFDTYLAFISSSTEYKGSDDDGGENTLSRLDFTAQTNGYYYVVLAGFSKSSTGNYTVEFSANENVVYSWKRMNGTEEKNKGDSHNTHPFKRFLSK